MPSDQPSDQPSIRSAIRSSIPRKTSTLRGKKKSKTFRRFWGYNPFGAPKSLPMLSSSTFVPEKGFPVVKALRNLVIQIFLCQKVVYLDTSIVLWSPQVPPYAIFKYIRPRKGVSSCKGVKEPRNSDFFLPKSGIP